MRRICVIAIVVVAILVIVSGIVYLVEPQTYSNQKPTITILTYSSLLQYGPNATQAYNYVFGNFEKWYNVNIVIKNASGDLLTALEQTQGKGYDIVIGLNNLDSYAAYKSGLFYKFNVSNESYLNKTLFSYMYSNGYVIPYEYSFLTTDYNLSGPIPISIIKNLTYMDLYNSSIGSQYIVENPTTSITGEEFLLGQYSFYENVLHQNWTLFWKNARDLNITSDWSSGFSLFESGYKQMLYSYITDPAYNEYFNQTPIGTTPFYFQGKYYAWMEVLGMGILNSSIHKSLDEKFINWFLGQRVENLLPTNEWMFPANSDVILPQCYEYIPNPSNIIPLNQYVNNTFLYYNLGQLELEWDAIETQ